MGENPRVVSDDVNPGGDHPGAEKQAGDSKPSASEPDGGGFNFSCVMTSPGGFQAAKRTDTLFEAEFREPESVEFFMVNPEYPLDGPIFVLNVKDQGMFVVDNALLPLLHDDAIEVRPARRSCRIVLMSVHERRLPRSDRVHARRRRRTRQRVDLAFLRPLSQCGIQQSRIEG